MADALGPRELVLQAAYTAHAGGVVAIAARVLGDRDLARDVCQETFIRFHDHGDEVSGDPGRWLRSVAWRLSLDILRRWRTERLALAARPAPATGGTRDPVEADEERAHVFAALAALSERQRDAVLLRIVSGDRFSAIARELHLSEGSVKVHFRRGVERLRELLAPLLEEIHGMR